MGVWSPLAACATICIWVFIYVFVLTYFYLRVCIYVLLFDHSFIVWPLWYLAAAGGSLVLLGNVRDCETIESIPVPHLRTLQLHPKISSSARWKSFSSQKEQISDHMRSFYRVFNLLAKAANTRMKAKAKNTKNTKLNWTTMLQCNDCFVSAPIATDHFMCRFLAAKFAIGFRNTKTIGTDLVSGWWCRDILTDLSASSTFTFIEGTWCNQRPKTLIEGQHGATKDLYWRNMVQLVIFIEGTWCN